MYILCMVEDHHANTNIPNKRYELATSGFRGIGEVHFFLALGSGLHSRWRFPQFLLLCNVFMWYFWRFVFSSLEAVAQCYNVTPQRKLTFHMSQTFLPSVILIIVAGISFFVPSDQVNQCEPRVHILENGYSIVFDPSDSWPACSMRDNSSHIHFHVQHCQKPHSTGISFVRCEKSIQFPWRSRTWKQLTFGCWLASSLSSPVLQNTESSFTLLAGANSLSRLHQ